MRALEKVLADELFAGLKREEAPEGDDEAIARVHPTSYIEALRSVAPDRGLVYIDGDTPMSPGTLNALLHGVGAALRATDAVMGGEVANVFCGVRPPGHHAEPERAMGFCFFNNVAIAAQHARARHGAERVAVVDFDVHHGNGTQAAFLSDKDLFYGSTHQMPLFPGTGALDETGVGNIFNAPLKAGDDGDEFRAAYQDRILPALDKFAPDLLIISAGFDAHLKDPLAQLRLLEPDFAWVTEQLLEAAAKHCGGKLVATLEGGYDLDALASSAAIHVQTLGAAS